MSRLIALVCIAAVGTGGAVAQSSRPNAAIAAAVASDARTPANRERDRYRHPAETLAFFGVKPTDTVVEFIPGGGWYTEILAPMVKDRGRYVALVPTSQGDRTRAMLAGKAAQFGGARVETVDMAAGTTTMAPGTADVVLTFRNVHNLLMQDNAAVPANAFKTFYAALKPGGTLGIVDHRLPEEMDTATVSIARSPITRSPKRWPRVSSMPWFSAVTRLRATASSTMSSTRTGAMSGSASAP